MPLGAHRSGASRGALVGRLFYTAPWLDTLAIAYSLLWR